MCVRENFDVYVTLTLYSKFEAIQLSESGSDSDAELGHQESTRIGLEQDESMMSYDGEGPDGVTHMEDSNVR